MRINYRWITIGIVVISVWIAFSGLSVVPLESHEVYVIHTAQEMSMRNDWVVPFCYGKPRLNKPPMSYWCTSVAAKLFRAEKVQPLHGRMVSAVSGVILVGLTMYIGWMLFGRSIGVIAGILLTSTMSFTTYTHNARPEMLYAMLCMAAFAFFLHAWRGIRFTRWASYGMWVAMGLATLAKGPHIPAILLIAFIFVLLIRKTNKRRIFLILRPLTGILLFLIITVPWWLAVIYRVGPEAFNASELAGSDYKLRLLDIFDPYYFYRPWSLLLAWVILWPSMIILLLKRRVSSSGARFLANILFIPIIILSFGHNKRWYYMLPFITPACIWMALAARNLFLQNHFPQRVRQWIVPAHFIMSVTALFILWGIFAQKYFSRTDHLIIILAILIMIILYSGLLYIQKNKMVGLYQKKWTEIVSIALFFIILNNTIMLTGMGHSARFNQVKMADTIRLNIEPDCPVISYRVTPDVLAYYSDRRIPMIRKLNRLVDELKKAPDKELVVVTQDKLVSSLSEHMAVVKIATIKNCVHKKDWSLIRVKLPLTKI